MSTTGEFSESRIGILQGLITKKTIQNTFESTGDFEIEQRKAAVELMLTDLSDYAARYGGNYNLSNFGPWHVDRTEEIETARQRNEESSGEHGRLGANTPTTRAKDKHGLALGANGDPILEETHSSNPRTPNAVHTKEDKGKIPPRPTKANSDPSNDSKHRTNLEGKTRASTHGPSRETNRPTTRDRSRSANHINLTSPVQSGRNRISKDPAPTTITANKRPIKGQQSVKRKEARKLNPQFAGQINPRVHTPHVPLAPSMSSRLDTSISTCT